MYKGLLQNYAQRRGLGMPAYDNESMGMDQATCFKASVTVGGQTFKSPQFFSLLKDAEHAAAKVAMEFFLPEGNLEAMLLSEEGRFYKNLLCEMTQKEGLALPVYDTVSDGPSHMPTFASRVEIEGERFQGSVMKTKKQAEDDAAKVAWTRLREPLCLGSDDAAQRKNQSDPPGGADISNSSKLAEEIGGGGEPVPGSYGRREPSSPRSRGDDEISSASASVQGKYEFTASEEESSTSAIRVIVCPRKNNSQLPAGARLLPFSDDMWMAVRIE
ncbi:unnamed protein product [Spirodela intermedia]|uniref:DRBM domain-containing protein n=1 Tax=Spirodela intermedia TaxID=51605 RepID=A0A7I8JWS1_SPIIN|nr:unnamed protein product [Spirodela intermedia]